MSGNEGPVLEKLREEFHFFLQDELTFAKTTVEVILGARPWMPSLVATKILEHVTVYRSGPTQYMDYGGKALTLWDHQEETIRIYSEDPDRLYELAFLSIHSILGQELEKRGLCRVHAVAISLNHQNALIMLPSKGGKSTLLAELISNPEVRIISDDMPLVDARGSLHPFPSKISLSVKPLEGVLSKLQWTEFKRTHFPPKWTAGLSQLNERIERQSHLQPNLIFAGFRLSSGESFIESVPKWKLIKPMFEHMIMGIGLPQVLEMFLNFDLTDIPKLFHHGVLRITAALSLVLKAKCYFIYMGPDISANAKLISDKLNE